MARNDRTSDAEDYFADTRMSFADHIEELRTHLWRAIKGFGICLILCFFVGKPVLEFIAKPVEEQMGKFYDRRRAAVLERLRKDPTSVEANRPTEFVELDFVRSQFLADREGKSQSFPKPVSAEEKEAADKQAKDRGEPLPNLKVIDPDDIITRWVRIKQPVEWAALQERATREVGRRPGLTTLSVQEAFVVYFKVCIVCGIVLSSPWIFIQVWSFVAAGLYPHEKKYVHLYLPFSLGLFWGGVLLCQFLVLPRAIEALLWFNEWIGLEPDLRLNEWLGFAILLPLIFGVSFQTPLVMLFLERLGIFTIEGFRQHRKIAIMVMAVISAILTPTPDAITMLCLLVPLCGLYELGIFLCWLSPRRDLGLDVPEPEEMVEV